MRQISDGFSSDGGDSETDGREPDDTEMEVDRYGVTSIQVHHTP